MFHVKIISTAFVMLFLSSHALAGTHYVDDDGDQNWADCQGASPLSGEAACSMSTANSNVRKGDIVNIRAGTYGTSIAPVASGDGDNIITYQAYNAEVVTIKDVTAIKLSNNRHIVIDGVDGYDGGVGGYDMISLSGSHYNEIKNGVFYRLGEPDAKGRALIMIRGGSGFNTHNWLHHNRFYGHGALVWDAGQSECDDKGRIMMLGDAHPDVNDTASNNNTIEDNELFRGGHHIIYVASQYNVIRNNVMHNECWMAKPPVGYTMSDCAAANHEGCTACGPEDDRYGKYGGRNVMWADGNGYGLMEGNRVGHAGRPPDDDGANNIITRLPHIIIRHNASFGANSSGIYLRESVKDVFVYNNTIYYNGRIDNAPMQGGAGLAGIVISTDGVTGHVINNIVYDNQRDWAGSAARWSGVTRRDNWCTTNEGAYCAGFGDPKFINTSLAWWNDPAHTSTRPDLSLQSDSNAIDSASHLTQTNNSHSNSTTLVVDEAGFFQDGSWGSGLSDIQADWIAIGTVSNTVQIDSINYDTNTITLASPMTWNNNANVWLYKKSDGKTVLIGDRPDYGAFEYNSAPSAPRNLVIIK